MRSCIWRYLLFKMTKWMINNSLECCSWKVIKFRIKICCLIKTYIKWNGISLGCFFFMCFWGLMLYYELNGKGKSSVNMLWLTLHPLSILVKSSWANKQIKQLLLNIQVNYRLNTSVYLLIELLRSFQTYLTSL